MSITKNHVFECKCGKTWACRSNTRARCPACGSFTRTQVRSEILRVISDPRLTLSKCQDALEAIVERAKEKDGASDIDVQFAKILMDGMKYLTPALEASMVQQTNDNDIVLKLLGTPDADNHPTLPARHQEALPGRSQPADS